MFLLAFASIAPAQYRELPALTELVSTIKGDTTATGARKYTEYGLQRGAVYFTLGQIAANFNLTLKATGDATLDRPFVKILVDESGSFATPYKPFKKLTLDGISFSGVTSAGSRAGTLIETGTQGVKITVKNCEFDSISSRVILMNQNFCSIFASDVIDHNSGTSNKTGRFIDGRSTFADSIVIVNSTFYNLFHTVFNRFGGQERYFKADHLTIYNVMTCPLRICESPDITMTNSLVIQTGFIGYDSYWIKEYSNPAWLSILEDRDEWSRIELCPLVQDTFVTKLNLTQKIKTVNNNFWLDPAVYTVYADTVHRYVNLDFLSARVIGADTLTWISEDPGFTKAPVCKSIEMSTKVHSVPGSGGSANEVGFDYSNPPYDFSYPTTKASYTAAEGGFPLGDLNWFPARKTAWEAWVKTGVANKAQTIAPAVFTLEQNYPNPFNPSTSISYTTQSAQQVHLAIYNLLGQKVRTLVDQKQAAGAYTRIWDGSDDTGALVAGGVYYYSLQIGSQKAIRKMTYIR